LEGRVVRARIGCFGCLRWRHFWSCRHILGAGETAEPGSAQDSRHYQHASGYAQARPYHVHLPDKSLCARPGLGPIGDLVRRLQTTIARRWRLAQLPLHALLTLMRKRFFT
jgi:hypothetical protein